MAHMVVTDSWFQRWQTFRCYQHTDWRAVFALLWSAEIAKIDNCHSRL